MNPIETNMIILKNRKCIVSGNFGISLYNSNGVLIGELRDENFANSPMSLSPDGFISLIYQIPKITEYDETLASRCYFRIESFVKNLKVMLRESSTGFHVEEQSKCSSCKYNPFKKIMLPVFVVRLQSVNNSIYNKIQMPSD
jgi:hypothetical protein